MICLSFINLCKKHCWGRKMRNVQAKKSCLDGSKSICRCHTSCLSHSAWSAHRNVFQQIFGAWRGYSIVQSPNSIVSWMYWNQTLIAINHSKLKLFFQVELRDPLSELTGWEDRLSWVNLFGVSATGVKMFLLQLWLWFLPEAKARFISDINNYYYNN